MNIKSIAEIHSKFERVDLSIDIETLSANKLCNSEGFDPVCAPVDEKAKVIQVGLVAFDPFTVSTEEELERHSWGVNIDHLQPGRTESESTVKWWREQDPQVWHNICQDQVDLEFAMQQLAKTVERIATPDTRLWYRGDCFDHTILQNALFYFGKQLKVPFWNIRDVRSPEDVIFRRSVQRNFRFGDHHDAVHDAMSQARLVQECYRVTDGLVP